MTADLLTRARGTWTILRALPGQRRILYLPPERLHALRDRRVRELVRYAAETVPHYRDLFRTEGIDPGDIRTAGDLAALPLLEKRAVQADPERFRSTSPRGAAAIAFHTAGSTGTPTRIYRDRASLLANVAYSERERTVESHFCGARYRYPVVQLTLPEGNDLRVRAYYDTGSFRPLRPVLTPVSMADPPERIAAALAQLRPLVLRGRGSAVEHLFRVAAERGLELHLPRVVLYGADRMTDEGRRLIEDRFGVPVLSRFGAIESFKIGFSCEERRGLHLHEDLCHAWIAGPDGRPVESGAHGEIVISDLTNRGSVLLNYRLGDLGRLAPAGCSCGRTSRLLADLEGRVDEIVELADGTCLHPILLEAVLRERSGILRFQIEQLERERFVVRLETVDEPAYRHAAEAVGTELHRLLRGADVTVERQAELVATPGGKFRPVLPLPRREALAALPG